MYSWGRLQALQSKQMGGWHLRMTWDQKVCYVSLYSDPASGGTWGWLGVESCQLCLQDTSRSPKWHRQAVVGHCFIACFKCHRMVDSVPRWQLSLSWSIQSDHLLIAGIKHLYVSKYLKCFLVFDLNPHCCCFRCRVFFMTILREDSCQ